VLSDFLGGLGRQDEEELTLRSGLERNPKSLLLRMISLPH
jgi:hypothetical protein